MIRFVENVCCCSMLIEQCSPSVHSTVLGGNNTINHDIDGLVFSYNQPLMYKVSPISSPCLVVSLWLFLYADCDR